MAQHTPPVDELHNAYAVAQIHHEMKIIGIVPTIEDARALCKETGNLGYPCFVFPVPLAFVPRGTKYAQPNYK